MAVMDSAAVPSGAHHVLKTEAMRDKQQAFPWMLLCQCMHDLAASLLRRRVALRVLWLPQNLIGGIYAGHV